jgi:hypothetical protein
MLSVSESRVSGNSSRLEGGGIYTELPPPPSGGVAPTGDSAGTGLATGSSGASPMPAPLFSAIDRLTLSETYIRSRDSGAAALRATEQ